MTPPATDTATGVVTVERWYRRAAATGLWVRDTGLGMVGVAILIVVAVAGWSGSSLGLARYAAEHMGFEGWTQWLTPVSFDGASVGLSFAAFRAAINGRSAPVTRASVAAFTALSSWMNYQRITDPTGRIIAALLPVAGVVLLESLLSEARRAYERRRFGDQRRPRIHPLRIVFDWMGTWRLFRAIVMAVPLPATAPVAAVAPAASSTNAASVAGTAGATVTPIRRAATGASGGVKVAAMREIFDRYVAEGRLDELTKSGLARMVGAHTSLGRRYYPIWKAALEATEEAK